MSINDITKKIKSFWTIKILPLFTYRKFDFTVKEEIFVILSIILIGLAGFGLGRISAEEKARGFVEIKPAIFTALAEEDTIDQVKIVTNIPLGAAAMVASIDSKGLLVASKSGKKYHFPWCAGASQIADKNKIWFDTYTEARSAGYTAASNCKGLE